MCMTLLRDCLACLMGDSTPELYCMGSARVLAGFCIAGLAGLTSPAILTSIRRLRQL